MINLNLEDLITTVYLVYTTTSDGLKGALVGVFDSYENAHEGAYKKGSWGTRGVVEAAKAIVSGDDVFVLKFLEEPMMKMGEDVHMKRIEELNKTLDKLSPEDIDRLGVDVDQLKKSSNPIESPLEST